MNDRERLNSNFWIAKSVSRGRIKDEVLLQSMKWFDYRFLSASEATELFAKAYVEIFKKCWATYQDRDESVQKQPLKPLKSDLTEYNSLWRARQVADGLGLP